MNTGIIRTLRHVLLAVSALTGFHCPILDQWPKWRLPAFIIFQDILCDFAYKLCRPTTIMFDAALKTCTKKRRQDLKIIDVEACTDLIGLELHQMGYTNLRVLDSSQKMLNEARKKGIYTQFFCLPIDDQRILELNTGDYDALFFVNGFGNNHILPSALAEMCRIVVKGKLLVYSHWYN